MLSQTGDVKYVVPLQRIDETLQVEKYEIGELLIQLKGIVLRVYLVVHRNLLNSSMSFETTLEHCIKDVEKLQNKFHIHTTTNNSGNWSEISSWMNLNMFDDLKMYSKDEINLTNNQEVAKRKLFNFELLLLQHVCLLYTSQAWNLFNKKELPFVTCHVLHVLLLLKWISFPIHCKSRIFFKKSSIM